MADVEATSRAVIEVARAGGKVADSMGRSIDAGKELGEFLTGSALKQIPRAVVSILGGDWIIGKQVENIIGIQARIHGLARDRGLKLDPSTLPWRVKLEAIRGMADEEDESLQNLWARLMVQSMRDDDKRMILDRIIVDTVRRLSPLSARMLEIISDEKAKKIDLKRRKLVFLFSEIQGIEASEAAVIMDHLTQLRCVQHRRLSEKDHSTSITALGSKIIQLVNAQKSIFDHKSK